MSLADIIENYSELTEEDIKAALAYAADREHKIGINREIAIVCRNFIKPDSQNLPLNS